VNFDPSNPDQAGDWYANQPPDDGRTMLEIAAAQLRYALESDEPSAAMRTTLTTAQNALNLVLSLRPRGGDELRPLLVALGLTIASERYVGQGKTAAAHEFADAALRVIKALEQRRRESPDA